MFVIFVAARSGVLWWQYDQTLANERRRAENLSVVLAEHLDRSFGAIKSALNQLAVHGEKVGGPTAPTEAWTPALNAALSGLSAIGSLNILDADGIIIYSTNPAVVGTSRRDFELYRQLRDNPQSPLAIGSPLKSPNVSGLTVPVGLALRDRDGSFVGFLAGTFQPERLRGFYRTIDLGPHGVIRMLDSSGRVMFRQPARGITNEPAAPDIAAAQFAGTEGFVNARIEPGGERYLTAWQAVSDAPLAIAVSIAERDALAGWYSEVAIVAGVGVGMALMLAIAGIWITASNRVYAKTLAERDRADAARTAAAIRLQEADAALRSSQARFQAIMDFAPAQVAVKDLQGRYTFVNHVFEKQLGKSSDAILGKTATDLFGAERAEFFDKFDSDVIAGRKPLQREMIGAGERSVLLVKFPLFNSLGAIEAVGSIATDVTELRRVESTLAHAQKMEAVGQLTGGIAHDFNNLLTVILGNAELLMERTGADERALAELMMQAAERGADLTRRLLAYGRRQMLAPQPTDANALIEGMQQLMRRTLGEHIVVNFHPAKELWQVTVDVGQLETAILNLAVNARDAMPSGGQLALSTENVVLDENYALLNPDVTPGDCVLIAVEDRGSGMTPDVVARVFEPFFTTKEVGKGTGLGLSMVYGFIKQSGGHIKIYSEVGVGTAIKLFLPRTHVATDSAAVAKRGKSTLPTGNEVILVVEDDALVRRNTETQLTALGYKVATAENGIEALAMVNDDFMPDLVLTDIVMPGGLNGRDLATKLRERWPDLKILFTSGYAHGANMEPLNGTNSHFIGKPFRQRDLAAKVREVLDQSPAIPARDRGAA